MVSMSSYGFPSEGTVGELVGNLRDKNSARAESIPVFIPRFSGFALSTIVHTMSTTFDHVRVCIFNHWEATSSCLLADQADP